MSQRIATELIKACNADNYEGLLSKLTEIEKEKDWLNVNEVINYRVPIESASNGDVETADATTGGYSAFHAACTNPNARILQLLLDKGADINKKDSSDKTPLEIVKDCIGILATQTDELSRNHLSEFIKMKHILEEAIF